MNSNVATLNTAVQQPQMVRKAIADIKGQVRLISSGQGDPQAYANEITRLDRFDAPMSQNDAAHFVGVMTGSYPHHKIQNVDVYVDQCVRAYSAFPFWCGVEATDQLVYGCKYLPSIFEINKALDEAYGQFRGCRQTALRALDLHWKAVEDRENAEEVRRFRDEWKARNPGTPFDHIKKLIAQSGVSKMRHNAKINFRGNEYIAIYALVDIDPQSGLRDVNHIVLRCPVSGAEMNGTFYRSISKDEWIAISEAILEVHDDDPAAALQA